MPLLVLIPLAGYDRGFHLLLNPLLVTVPILLAPVAGLVGAVGGWWLPAGGPTRGGVTGV